MDDIIHYILTFAAVLAAILVAPLAREFISKNADDYIATAKERVAATMRWRGWRTILHIALCLLIVGACIAFLILILAAKRDRDLYWVFPVLTTIGSLGYWSWFVWGVKNRNLEGIGWGLFGGIFTSILAIAFWMFY